MREEEHMPISADLNGAVTKLCQDLIRTPSVNGRDPERAVAEVAANFARAHGLWVDLPALDPHRPNLLVRAGPPGNAALLLVAHLDTVAEGEISTWRHAPFGAHIEHGRIYGRGACDNKGGLAAALGALVAAKHLELPFPILLAGVPDEEAGATGTLGIKYLHEMGLLSGRGAIYVYPGNRELVIGHRGVLRLVLRTRGKAFHSGSREWQDGLNGYNAVVGMAEILSALEKLEFDDRSPGTLFAPYHTVITPTTIAGGNGPSMVPALCEARVDIRLVPAVSREQVEAAVRNVVNTIARRRPPLQVNIQVEAVIPTTQISQHEAIVSAAQAAVRTVLGHDPVVTVSGPANESYLLNGFGIPTCIIGPDGGNAHAADEYVDVESLIRTIEVYTQVAAAMA